MAKKNRYYAYDDAMISGAMSSEGTPKEAYQKDYPTMEPASYDRPYDSIEGIDAQMRADKKYKPAKTKY